MRVARLALLISAVFASLSAPATDTTPRRAVILPEVQKHMDAARDCASNGTPEVAAAHANLVLVGDEVTYAIEYVGVSGKLHSRCEKALAGAFDAWEKALDDTVTFRETSDSSKADVVIRFKREVMMGREPVAGYANWNRSLKSDGSRVQTCAFKSDLQIRTINLDGQPMPFACVRHEIAHELGHILGLEDSDITGDLMGPLDIDHPVGGPQNFEATAIRRLRDEAHRLRTDALAKVLK